MNYGSENKYGHQVFLYGTLLERTWLKPDEIAKGGTLTYIMGKTPF